MDSEDGAFFLYVAIVSFQFHPGVKVRLTPLECAVETWKYLDEFKKRGDVWRGSDQPLERERA